jgi:hypothetical protein
MTLTPSNLGLLVLLALCVLGSVAAYFVMRQRLPLKLQRFKGREHLSIKQIRDQFYAEYEIETFSELWNEVASSVEVPPELMRPTDRFDEELGPVKGFALASEMDDLEEGVMRRCHKTGLNFRNLKIETVDDYVRLFAKA